MSEIDTTTACTCGHVEDEHDAWTGSCDIDGCLCGGYEPEDSDE